MAMKNLFLILLIFLSSIVYSQQNAVKVGLLGLTIGDYSLGYEREITSNSSLNFSVAYWDLNNSIVNFKSLTDIDDGFWLSEFKNGYNAAIEYRFYVGSQESLKGFYLAPYAR